MGEVETVGLGLDIVFHSLITETQTGAETLYFVPN
jgi:hypothetical protein